MNSYEPQKHQNHSKKRKSLPISTFSPPLPKAQPNRHLYHPQNTIPRPQKAPRVKRTQNDEKRSKTRVFSTFSLSPLPDNESSPNLRKNRTRNALLHPQKVLQVKRKQNNKNRTQTPHSPHISHISPSSLPDNEKRRNLHWNRRRSDPLHPQKVPQLNRNEKGRKNCPKPRQLTPHIPTMDLTPAARKEMVKILLEVKAIQEERGKLLEVLATTLREMRADMKAQGTMVNLSSTGNVIPPVPHLPSLPSPSPVICQPSYTSISTQTTPPVVHQPSYASVSVQTEPLVDVATPIFTNSLSPPIPQPPPTPTSSVGLIPSSLPPLLPTLPIITVSVPISESMLSGSITPSRPQASSERLGTLRPRPYPPSQLRPAPEPPPGSGPTSRVRRGRRTLMRG